MNTMTKKILIAGIGNIARMDDGIGVHVIRYINESNDLNTECVETLEIGSAIYDLMPVMMGRRKVILVDAIKANAPPGSVYSITSNNLSSDFWKLLGKSPELRSVLLQCYIASGEFDIDLIGIEPDRTDLCSMLLSESVKKNIPVAASEILKIISQFVKNNPEYIHE